MKTAIVLPTNSLTRDKVAARLNFFYARRVTEIRGYRASAAGQNNIHAGATCC